MIQTFCDILSCKSSLFYYICSNDKMLILCGKLMNGLLKGDLYKQVTDNKKNVAVLNCIYCCTFAYHYESIYDKANR